MSAEFLQLAALFVAFYVSTLTFVAYVMWMRKQTSMPEQEVQKLRTEMSQLAMAVGLRHRNMNPIGPHPIEPPK